MRSRVIDPASCFKGGICLPGDKSIAHRAVILSSLSTGVTNIENFPTSRDCLFTLEAFKKLGIAIRILRRKSTTATLKVVGSGLYGLTKPKGALFIGDSGTTLRLLLGVLAGQDFEVTLTAGKSLTRRPMKRVTAPLRCMGAFITAIRDTHGAKQDEHPPFTIHGSGLKSIHYKLPVASAQVKSAILLAGLYARGRTSVVEPIPARDHTERMLRLFKARVTISKGIISVAGGRGLVSPGNIYIPGDISSASFFLVAAALVSNSRIEIKNVGINPTRIGILKVLKRMGARIQLKTRIPSPRLERATSGNFSSGRQNSGLKTFEPMGDIIVKTSHLKGAKVPKREIPFLIDELPILMVAASMARGKSLFEGVGELREKETDRIMSMCSNLKRMGADIKAIKVGASEQIVINGVKELKGAKVKSFGDHRTAMSMIVAGLAAKGSTKIDDISCIHKSFPDFLNIITSITKPAVLG